MRIKRIDITGFKSFMERMVFTFDEGITAVVGPNGCGKSNVVDAIRWVMGEQSAKSLRGRGMEDVIFKGSETHPALSMAEVTITFKIEEDDLLPEGIRGLPEVSVTRRLFRGGESEYQINHTTCRLLDVSELFLGTGVGKGAYSIIEQGRIGQIVSARPEDRRGFIEEAAGVSKYKARRKSAERKLEHTEQNLLRVSDVTRELDRRRDSLERQARKAEKYRELKDEIRAIELRSTAFQWLELRAKQQFVFTELEGAISRERDMQEELHRADSVVETHRESLGELGTTQEAARIAVSELESEERVAAERELNARERKRVALAREAELRNEREVCATREQEVAAEQEQLTGEHAVLVADLAASQVAVAAKGEELKRATDHAQSAASTLEAEQAQLAALAASCASQEAAREGLARQRLTFDERLAAHERELAAARAEVEELEQRRRVAQESLENHRRVALELAGRRGEEEAALLKTRESLAEHEVLLIARREELADKRSRLAALEEFRRQYEGFDRGVRAAMALAQGSPDRGGIVGVISDLVTVEDPRFERAIEGVLGERLQHIVVSSTERACALAEHLRELAEGRATFVPLSSAGEAAPRGNTPPEVLAMAAASVQVADESARAVVLALLGDVAIVRELADARAAVASAPELTFVTLAGEVLRADGSVTGGVLEGPAVGALTKKREIAQLEQDIAEAAEAYNALVTRQYELQRAASHCESVLKGLEKHERQEEVLKTGDEKDVNQAGASLSKLMARIEQIDDGGRKLLAHRGQLDEEIANLERDMSHGALQRAGLAERARGVSDDLQRLKLKLEALRNEDVELQLQRASALERLTALERRREGAERQRAELSQRAQELAAAMQELENELQELEKRIESVERERAARAHKLEEARAAAASARAAYNEAVEKLRRLEGMVRVCRTDLELATQRVGALSFSERELSMSIDHLLRGASERHGVLLSDAVYEHHSSAPLTPEEEATLVRLRSQLERMGEVNVGAIDEFREVSERSEYLHRQKLDLEQSIERLRLAIERIDETSHRRFKETFELIDRKFQVVFPRLFGGGRASLALVPAANGDEPGIEILTQPPGKKLQSVSLLSGGETALTAVSLIFAIFLIKPTPFCLLDEVDAPLDEGNVGRYNQMVRDMARTSQFILITHNRRTMEIADALYGVTMEEPGVSKLVSVRLREAADNSDLATA